MRQSDGGLEIGKQEERFKLSRCFVPVVCQSLSSASEILSMRDHKQSKSIVCFSEGKGLCITDRKDEMV